jgi:hypothetical protein
MKELLKLINVKSIVTLTLTSVFSYLSVVKFLEASDFMLIFAMIMTFYFTKKEV